MAALIFWMLLLLLLAVVVGWKDSWRYNSGWNNEARTTDEERVGVAVVVESRSFMGCQPSCCQLLKVSDNSETEWLATNFTLLHQKMITLQAVKLPSILMTFKHYDQCLKV